MLDINSATLRRDENGFAGVRAPTSAPSRGTVARGHAQPSAALQHRVSALVSLRLRTGGGHTPASQRSAADDADAAGAGYGPVIPLACSNAGDADLRWNPPPSN